MYKVEYEVERLTIFTTLQALVAVVQFLISDLPPDRRAELERLVTRAAERDKPFKSMVPELSAKAADKYQHQLVESLKRIVYAPPER